MVVLKSNRGRSTSVDISQPAARNPGMPHGVPHYDTSLSSPNPHYFLSGFQHVLKDKLSDQNNKQSNFLASSAAV